MHLDIVTMSAADIAVTAVLASMLLLNWGRDGWSLAAAPRFVGAWGLAVLVRGIGGLAMLGSVLGGSADGIAIGASLVILSSALKWNATRRFAERPALPFLIALGPAGFLAVVYSGLVPNLDGRFIAGCLFLAAYSFVAALELRRMPDASQCWPAIALLVLCGVTYLVWIPFAVVSPLGSVSAAFSSDWLAYVVVTTLLLRVALAFLVLSLAKDRDEEEQRRYALTDSLTGLPNRRSLFESAELVVQRRVLGGGTPVSVLICDLDCFKDTNDTFGHTLGDDVLRLFARVATRSLQVNHEFARLGGEEFAAILPSVDGEIALEEAERLRDAFEQAGAFVNGLPVGATVSIGVSADREVDPGLSTLFRRADAALYAAKRAGRNRVVFIGSNDDDAMTKSRTTVRTSPSRLRPKRSWKPHRPVQTF